MQTLDILFLLILLYLLLTHTRIELFESSTTTIPLDTINKTCTANMNISEYCKNYDTCCNQTISTMNNDCFCNHPTVKKCNDDYNHCIANQNQNCNDILKSCCNTHNNINIDNTLFHQPIQYDKQNKILCSLTTNANIEQKCMELCQTTPACKSYSINAINCTLYNDNDLDLDNIKQKTTTKYYIKK